MKEVLFFKLIKMKTWISDSGIVFQQSHYNKWIEVQPNGVTYLFDLIMENECGVLLKKAKDRYDTWVWIGQNSLDVNDHRSFYIGKWIVDIHLSENDDWESITDAPDVNKNNKMKTWISDNGIVFHESFYSKWIEVQPNGVTYVFDQIAENECGVMLRRGKNVWVWIGQSSLDVNQSRSVYVGKWAIEIPLTSPV